jgi:hypothetical protein
MNFFDINEPTIKLTHPEGKQPSHQGNGREHKEKLINPATLPTPFCGL